MPLLEARKITAGYFGVPVLRGVDLSLEAGEVVGLVGANGAGKSTLVRVLTGELPSYQGEITVDGQPVRLATPGLALAAGIAVVHQEVDVGLFPGLSVLENLLLTNPRLAPGWRFPQRPFHQTAEDLLRRVGSRPLDLSARVATLPVAERQLIAIAKALAANSRVLLLDEPTSALGPEETHHLHRILARLKEEGVGILYISHHLNDVLAVTDRILVMRGGTIVHEARRREGTYAEGTVDRVVEAMLARRQEALFPEPSPVEEAQEVLRVEGLSAHNGLHRVDLMVRRGEVVAVTGLVGAGKSELARVLYGLDRPVTGRMWLEGRPYRPRHPAEARRLGVAYVPEDRHRHGLILGDSVTANLSLPNLALLNGRSPFVPREREALLARRLAEAVRLVAPSLTVPVRALSGGNQQRVVLGKWLTRPPLLLLMDEPTRGVDVGARADLYKLIHDFARQGMAVVVFTSEPEEAVGLGNRIVVMRRGTSVFESRREAIDAERILALATGGAV